MKVLVYGDSICEDVCFQGCVQVHCAETESAASMVAAEDSGVGLGLSIDLLLSETDKDKAGKALDCVVIIAGHYDRYRDPADTVTNLMRLHEVARQRNLTSVAVSLNVRGINSIYREAVKAVPGILWLNSVPKSRRFYTKDMLHLTEQGSALLSNRIWQLLGSGTGVQREQLQPQSAKASRAGATNWPHSWPGGAGTRYKPIVTWAYEKSK